MGLRNEMGTRKEGEKKVEEERKEKKGGIEKNEV